MGYTVPKDLTTLHNFPRYDALKGMAVVSKCVRALSLLVTSAAATPHRRHAFSRSNFNPDVKTAAGKEYLEGVGSLFGAYVAMAVVLVTVFGTLFLASCCCRKKICPPRDKSRKRGCLVRSTRWRGWINSRHSTAYLCLLPRLGSILWPGVFTATLVPRRCPWDADRRDLRVYHSQHAQFWGYKHTVSRHTLQSPRSLGARLQLRVPVTGTASNPSAAF